MSSMVQRPVPVVLVIGLLLVASLPAPVTAQGVPRSVLLDEDSRKIADVTVDGETYTVYRIENVVWFASGIEIYAGDERVTAEATAREVLSTLAHRRAAAELGRDELRTLRRTSAAVADTTPAITASATAINDTLAHLDELRSADLNGSTAYNASVGAAPTIERFTERASALQSELRGFRTAAAAVDENATELIALLERRRNGTDVDPQRLYDRYAATARAIDALSEHTGFGGVDDGLEDVRAQSRTIAENVTTVPQYGEETARHFSRVASTAGRAANRSGSLQLPGYEFEEVRRSARTLESDWMDRWRSRQNAGTDVSYTLVGIGVAVVAAVGYFARR